MKLDPITLISLITGALTVGTVGAFFLFVSPLSIIYAVITLLAIFLMFGLGVVWGREAHFESSSQDLPEKPDTARLPGPRSLVMRP